jgi:endosialidase-like protein/trimeric autotransporter adhesin
MRTPRFNSRHVIIQSSILLLILMSSQALAQAPQGVTYQAVARDGAGTLIQNQSVGLRLSIYNGSPGGTLLYKETHNATTNMFGLVTVPLGQGNTVSGTFSSIDWGNGTKFIGVELDPPGAAGYTSMGASQILSVPYALYAGSASETDPVYTASAVFGITLNDIAEWDLAYGWGDHASAGYLSSYTETDPVYTAAPASGIAAGDITNWNTAFGWGDHSLAGYLTSVAAPTLDAAYDGGGTGSGKTITADAGAVAIAGVDGFVASGTENSGGIPATGSGVRMMWYPNKAAFRAGKVHSTQWDDSNIGSQSVAMGTDTKASSNWATALGHATTASAFSATSLGEQTTASGFASTASGYQSEASGIGATALGYQANASNDYATSLGMGTTASGQYSTAVGYETNATGSTSTSMGNRTTASGSSSTAIGYQTLASAYYSTAMGSSTTASGNTSLAAGYNTTASGVGSFAMGYGTKANAHSSVAIGRWNIGGGDAGSWVLTDPLFEIGNGNGGITAPSNALTVLKNGNTGIGTATPGAKLEVSGQVKITGGTPGAGKVLTSDAAGLATWTTPAAGGGGSLDAAYDFGGAGAGKTIIANAGAVTIAGVDGFLATGTYNSGTIPATGAGTRMMWYPKKAAFRAGTVNSTQWDDANIGAYSTATGLKSIASGLISTALGGNTTASGMYATAMGYASTASGESSTAMGCDNTASNYSSTAMGTQTTASGRYSTAMGGYTTASGLASTAMGNSTTASGDYSTAMGSNVSTNSKSGSFIIGDYSPYTTLTSSAHNQMKMRFNGGYQLFTNNGGGSAKGVYMNGGTSGWTNYSDRNKKENFEQLDGELLLSRLRKVPVTSWNYIAGDKSIRYMGPMAQDFWQAFKLGGTDSLGINSISIDGVNMAAIKALDARTEKLHEMVTELQSLKKELAESKAANAAMRNELSVIRTMLEKQGLRSEPKNAKMVSK